MSSGITVVGLGPGDDRYWTQAALTVLNQAAELHLRTAHHPSVAALTTSYRAYDDLLRQADDFQQAYRQIAAKIIHLGQRPRGVIYAVPGHPLVDEPTFPFIRALAESNRLTINIIPAPSILAATRTALNLDGSCSLQIVEATSVAQLHHPPLAPDRPALVTHLYHQNLAARVRQTLLNAYPGALTVTLVRAAGSDYEHKWSCVLTDLADQSRIDESTVLFLPPDESNSSFITFQETIARLRAPNGCPWDREQTHQSLRPYLLEEAYEVLEALDAKDETALAEELGDLLLQIVLHTQIGTEQGRFRMGEVIGHINRKMLRRHPHVFGNVTVSGADEVVTNWQTIKKAEKQAQDDPGVPNSILDGLPAALPALAQTLAISNRVVRVGFEWRNVEGVLDKLVEEAREITEAANAADLEAEIGDFLFNVVNLARWYDIDPESALRAANARFARRFRTVEGLAAAEGRALTDMSLEEMLALWAEAKRSET